ncbi:MAG TPA: endonuclease domain-containing protein [Saprospiraceae bacterium]|nr:endonuclease domain-containing protein [Saprospiraceae bacterium]
MKTKQEKASPKNNYHYNKALNEKANSLRKNMTKAEAVLWKYALKASYLGFGFRRQRPILNYIVDFVCLELMLIIEVDGLTHTWEETIEKDRMRDLELKAVGFHILRFSDGEILSDLENVIRAISFKIEALRDVHPQPPPKGENDSP